MGVAPIDLNESIFEPKSAGILTRVITNCQLDHCRLPIADCRLPGVCDDLIELKSKYFPREENNRQSAIGNRQ